MDAVEIVQALHELGVTLRAQGINLCLEPGSKVPAGWLEDIRRHKAAILRLISQMGPGGSGGFAGSLVPNIYGQTTKPQSHSSFPPWKWPPQDALELVIRWNELDRPQIPVCPGVSIANLETWLCSNWPEDRVSDQVGVVRRFLWEGLPKAEVPADNPLLEEWLRVSIPEWRHILVESTEKGDDRRAEYARWMLREILLDPEYEEPHS